MGLLSMCIFLTRYIYLSFNFGPMTPAGVPIDVPPSSSCCNVARDNDFPLLIPLQSRKNPNSQSENPTYVGLSTKLVRITLARKLESKNFVTQASVICRWKGLQQWIQKIVG